MSEEEALNWLGERFGGHEMDALHRFVQMLVDEMPLQNLIAPSTVGSLWARHVVDSAQLLDHAPTSWSHWLDIGTGAGFPGLIIAVLSGRRVTLIEPRKLRSAFLGRCATALGLNNVAVITESVERTVVASPADVVSARAVASLDKLILGASRLALPNATYVFPKGAAAATEAAAARLKWTGTFHVKQSVVDQSSGIVVVQDVRRR